MAKLPVLPLWVAEYLADTLHLTDAEHGRYLKFIMLLWITPGQKVPNDDDWLARRFRRSVEEVQRDLRPIIKEFFQCDGNWIWHKRVRAEWDRVAARVGVRRDAANSRWQKEKDPCKSTQFNTIESESDSNTESKTPNGVDSSTQRPPTAGAVSSAGADARAATPPEPPAPPPPEPPPEPPEKLDPPDKPSAREVAQVWNRVCGDVLPAVVRLTEARRVAARARLAECRGNLEEVERHFRRIRHSEFCCGQGPRGWIATFDWAITPRAWARVSEGVYDRRPEPSRARGNYDPIDIGRRAMELLGVDGPDEDLSASVNPPEDGDEYFVPGRQAHERRAGALTLAYSAPPRRAAR